MDLTADPSTLISLARRDQRENNRNRHFLRRELLCHELLEPGVHRCGGATCVGFPGRFVRSSPLFSCQVLCLPRPELEARTRELRATFLRHPRWVPVLGSCRRRPSCAVEW